MAQLPKPVVTQDSEPTPGTYVKAGQFKKAVQVVIEKRLVREGQEPGPCVGSFANSVDIPFRVDGRPFTVTVSTKSKDYQELVNNMGPDSEKWNGATILISDSPSIAGAIHVAYVGGP